MYINVQSVSKNLAISVQFWKISDCSVTDMQGCDWLLSLVTWLVSSIHKHSTIFCGKLSEVISGHVIYNHVNWRYRYRYRVDYKLATLVHKLHRTWSTIVSWSRTLDAPASLRSRQRPHCSENKHSTWRQEFLGRWSENLEQSTRLTAAAWHWTWTL